MGRDGHFGAEKTDTSFSQRFVLPNQSVFHGPFKNKFIHKPPIPGGGATFQAPLSKIFEKRRLKKSRGLLFYL